MARCTVIVGRPTTAAVEVIPHGTTGRGRPLPRRGHTSWWSASTGGSSAALAPGSVATALGLVMWLGYGDGKGSFWLHAKIVLVLVAVGYHHACHSLLRKFEEFADASENAWRRLLAFVARHSGTTR